MRTATAYCTSTTHLFQLPSSLAGGRSSAASPSKPDRDIENDENNNTYYRHSIAFADSPEFLDIVSDNDDDEDDDDEIDVEAFLACVGLRFKTRKRSEPRPPLRPLAKRLAVPVCLLPLPKYGERVRHALYILLPYMKFLSISHDFEQFCSLNGNASTTSLLLRSVTQSRQASMVISKTASKRQISKTELIDMATENLCNTNKRTPKNNHVHDALQCHLYLDRLDQSTIDRLMNISSSSFDSLPSVQPPLHEQIKTSSSPSSISTPPSKRFKTSHTDRRLSSTYQRIYLKCFVCSKREYIDAGTNHSDVLHTHWLEHRTDLALNIYDSDIESVLTRVVEFFHFPRRHELEGNVQTIFILNSEELRSLASQPLADGDTCIVID